VAHARDVAHESKEKGSVTRQKMGLVWDARYLDHDTGMALVSAKVPTDSIWEPQRHVARPSLVGRAQRLLERSGLLAHLEQIASRAATLDEVTRVHTQEHLERLRRICEQGGGEAGDFAPASPETYSVALLAAGGALAAVDAIAAGRIRNAYALLRPPGHHATPDQAMGFCFLNNVAIAARYAQDRLGFARVAILDWDVHHGNGTQAVFYDDPSVLFISLHQDNWYPLNSGRVEDVGTGVGTGFTINVPLPAGTGNAGYMCAVDRVVAPALHRFAPELILVSAGQDSSAVDPLARMAMSADGFRHMAARVAGLAADLCGGRLAALHEGGYSEGYAPVCTWAVVEGLCGVRTGHEDPYASWLGEVDANREIGPAAAAIDRVVERHDTQWGLA
jgi:acetoin utilization deacetylase AcuC-like enzyme